MDVLDRMDAPEALTSDGPTQIASEVATSKERLRFTYAERAVCRKVIDTRQIFTYIECQGKYSADQRFALNALNGMYD